MIEPRLPENEEDRLEALFALNILDTPEEERFDRITRLAAAMFNVPMALVTLVDRNRLWFKSRFGMALSEAPRSFSFCGHAIHHSGALLVPDASIDPRFFDNPLVTGAPFIRFYAGYPIVGPHGHTVGTLCIIDTRPRRADEINVVCLRDLAKLAEEEIGKTVVAQKSRMRKEELSAALRQVSFHLHNSPLAVVQWDHAFRVSEWSTRAEEMFGWTAADVMGKHPAEWHFIHDADHEIACDKMRELLDHEVSRNVSHNRNYRKDGAIVHGVWHNSALFNHDGTLQSVVSIVDDVTSRVKMEEELRESEAMLRATFEQVAVGMAQIGLDGSWLRVNAKLCNIVGYSEEELRALTFQQITHPDDLFVDLDLAQEILQNRRATYSVEKRYLRKNGTVTWANLTVSLKRDASGKPEYFITVAEDINSRKDAEFSLQRIHDELELRVEQRTLELKRSNDSLAIEIEQRRQTEAVLFASEERTRMIIKSSHDAFIGVDSSGIITDWNDAAETTFGWTAEETVGRRVGDVIIPPQHREKHRREFQRYLDSPAGVVVSQRLDMTALTRSGEEFAIEMTVSAYRIDGAIFFGAFLHDISERKRAAKQLAEKQNLLDAILETIDVAVIACGESGELSMFNRTAREFHGLAAEKIMPDQWASRYDLFGADGKTALAKEDIPLFQALQGKVVKDMEMTIVPKGSPPRYLQVSGRPLTGPKGEKLGAVVAMNDITERKESDRLLFLSEQRLRAIAENLPTLIGHIDTDEKFLFLNQRAARYFGKTPQDLIGKSIRDVYDETEYKSVKPHIDIALSGSRSHFEFEADIRGNPYYFQVIYIPAKDINGAVTSFYAMAFDITDRKKSELRQAESEERLRTITDSLPVLISYIDHEERYQFVNATFNDWFELSPQDMIGNTIEAMLGTEAYLLRAPYVKRALAGNRIRYEMDTEIKGRMMTIETVYIPDWKDGVVEGIYTLSTDVTSAKAVERQLYLLARIDALTELPNRRGFDEYLQEAILRCNRTGKPMALVLLDIDQFKTINDTFGHAGGDDVLKEFAYRLRNLVRVTDRVSRLAGDEFTIILEDIAIPDAVMMVARKILAAIQEPFTVQGKPFVVTTSIGIAFLHPGDTNGDRLSIHADEALYAAKLAGRNRFQVKQ